MPHISGENEEAGFAEFRRKVRTAEVLSAAVERLLTLRCQQTRWTKMNHSPLSRRMRMQG